jgi:hypothetical protein
VLAELAGGHADHSWVRRLRELARPVLLILDDFSARHRMSRSSITGAKRAAAVLSSRLSIHGVDHALAAPGITTREPRSHDAAVVLGMSPRGCGRTQQVDDVRDVVIGQANMGRSDSRTHGGSHGCRGVLVGAPGAPQDVRVWGDEPQRRVGKPVEPLDGEPGSIDGRSGVPVGVAAARGPGPEGSDSVLQ